MTLHSQISAGQMHVAYNWSYADQAAREGATGIVAGDVGKLARQEDTETLWLLTNHSPVTWQFIGGGNAVVSEYLSVSAAGIVVSAGDVATGTLDTSASRPGAVDGVVFLVSAAVTAGTSDDVDLELADGLFSGSPNILYQIGDDSEGAPNWAPTSDGAWNDRNAWGFTGLTDGLLHYRFTNGTGGSEEITVTLQVIMLAKMAAEG